MISTSIWVAVSISSFAFALAASRQRSDATRSSHAAARLLLERQRFTSTMVARRSLPDIASRL
ncbi:hypothetical protein ACLK1S_10415 [Escherichia coli]